MVHDTTTTTVAPRKRAFSGVALLHVVVLLVERGGSGVTCGRSVAQPRNERTRCDDRSRLLKATCRVTFASERALALIEPWNVPGTKHPAVVLVSPEVRAVLEDLDAYRPRR